LNYTQISKHIYIGKHWDLITELNNNETNLECITAVRAPRDDVYLSGVKF